MNFFRTIKFYAFILLTCSMVACGDSKNDDNGDGDYSDSPLTPDEHKSKLENVGKDFVAKIKAEDHEVVVNSLYDLANTMDNSNLDDFLPEEPDPVYPINPYALAQIIKTNDVNAMMKLSTKAMDDEYRIKDFEGIYIYNNNTREWSQQAASNKVELRYTINNTESVLTATFSGIKEYTKASGVLVEVPAKTEVTLTVNKQKVLNFTTDINLANDMYSVDVKSTLTLNDNYTWEINASAKSDKSTAAFKMTVKGEELINGTAELTGTKLTDPDYIEDKGESIFNTGKVDFTLMNVRISGNGDIKAIINGVDKIDEVYPGQSKYTEAIDKKNAETEMKLYNDYMKIEGFYVSEKQKFADIKMGLYYSDYNHWNSNTNKSEIIKDWDVQPILVFTDKSEIEFDTFFTETSFSSLISAVETLTNKYMDMVGEDHVDL